jgi:hypothetical protein
MKLPVISDIGLRQSFDVSNSMVNQPPINADERRLKSKEVIGVNPRSSAA